MLENTILLGVTRFLREIVIFFFFVMLFYHLENEYAFQFPESV